MKEIMICGICHQDNLLLVQWPQCNHLFCYSCIFNYMAGSEKVIRLQIQIPLRNSYAKTSKMISCPICRSNGVTFHDLFTSDFNSHSRNSFQVSRPLLDVAEVLHQDTIPKECTCLYCEQKFSTAFETLNHVHSCRERTIACLLCNHQNKMKLFERDGTIRVDFKHWYSHLNECKGIFYCNYDQCKKHLKAKNVRMHLALHCLLKNNPGNLLERLSEIMSDQNASADDDDGLIDMTIPESPQHADDSSQDYSDG